MDLSSLLPTNTPRLDPNLQTQDNARQAISDITAIVQDLSQKINDQGKTIFLLLVKTLDGKQHLLESDTPAPRNSLIHLIDQPVGLKPVPVSQELQQLARLQLLNQQQSTTINDHQDSLQQLQQLQKALQNSATLNPPEKQLLRNITSLLDNQVIKTPNVEKIAQHIAQSGQWFEQRVASHSQGFQQDSKLQWLKILGQIQQQTASPLFTTVKKLITNQTESLQTLPANILKPSETSLKETRLLLQQYVGLIKPSITKPQGMAETFGYGTLKTPPVAARLPSFLQAAPLTNITTLKPSGQVSVELTFTAPTIKVGIEQSNLGLQPTTKEASGTGMNIQATMPSAIPNELRSEDSLALLLRKGVRLNTQTVATDQTKPNIAKITVSADNLALLNKPTLSGLKPQGDSVFTLMAKPTEISMVFKDFSYFIERPMLMSEAVSSPVISKWTLAVPEMKQVVQSNTPAAIPSSIQANIALPFFVQLWPHLNIQRHTEQRQDQGVERLLRSLFNGIMRIQELQLENLTGHKERQMAGSQVTQWQFDMPIMHGDKVFTGKLNIYQQEQNTSSKKTTSIKEYGWGLRLNLALDENTSMTADAKLVGHQLNLSLWISEPSWQQKAIMEIPQLLRKLRQSGLHIDEISCQTGEAPRITNDNHLLDTHI